MAIAPDIDGIFTFIPGMGHLHRTFGHNVWLFIAAPLLATAFFVQPQRRLKIFPLLVISITLHFAMDLFVTGWWPLTPLWPVSDFTIYMDRYIPEHVMKYYVQISLLILFLIPTIMIYLRSHRTPLEIISSGFDRFIQNFVELPWRHTCAYCHRRAFYRCSQCGRPICGIHRKFGSRFNPICTIHNSSAGDAKINDNQPDESYH